MPTYEPNTDLPEPLYEALIEANEAYRDDVKEFLAERGQDFNISVTSLNRSPRQLLLEQRHYHEMHVEPMDNWHSFMGNIIHFVLEKKAARNPRYFTEIREGVTLKVKGINVLVHGKFDLYDKKDKAIEDWKLTSANNMLYPKDDYERQLNINKYILESRGYEVKKLRNVYLFPHLDKTKLKNPLYPQKNVLIVEVKRKKREFVEKFIKERIARVLDNKGRKDKDLDFCTDEERWVRGNTVAIYLRKKQSKTGVTPDFSSRAAVRADTEEEALSQLTEIPAKEDMKIVEYKGEPKKCSYCSAAPFCNQYQQEKLILDKKAQDNLF